MFKVIAPTVGGITSSSGAAIEADFQLQGGPSVLFDAIALAVSEAGAAALLNEAAAVSFVHDAFAHLKVIGHTAAAAPLLQKAGVMPDAGIVALAAGTATAFVGTAKNGRIWAREPSVRTVH